MSEPVTVAIPIGPSHNACRYLPEALRSVANQTIKPQLLLIDDMHDIQSHHVFDEVDIKIWRAPWRLGVAHAFNACVALADTDLVIMLGADDVLEPNAVEKALETYAANKVDAYYYFGVRYMDTGEEQTVPCGEAMVTKGLWDKTGGFPVESAVGAPDAALMSIMLVHMPELLIPIADGYPLVNYRRHAETDTAGRGPWQGPILASRDILTQTWKSPAWGRYSL